ncbi:TnpV protein [Ruminococcus sp. FMBCY1]|uniref:TnpV protein n=2 Tax=unclassified Ruminococcus TaxID=2608920 RepID=UPI00339D33CD
MLYHIPLTKKLKRRKVMSETRKTVNGIDYILGEDEIWYPDLPLPEFELNNWGVARRDYLKNNDEMLFEEMMMTGEILQHLETVQTQAQERYETLIEQKRKALGVTEELKEKDWLKWVQLANSIQEEARQEVLEEMIYI